MRKERNNSNYKKLMLLNIDYALPRKKNRKSVAFFAELLLTYLTTRGL